MTFYVVHKLKVKNPQSLTEGQVSESARLFKTTKANLFHRIAATYRDQIDRSIEVGDLVSDSESELRYWQLVFDISSTKENEEAIFERLDWIDNHIVDIVSSLQGVVFEPKLNSIHRVGKDDNSKLDHLAKELITQQVHEFVVERLVEHNQIKLTKFSGLGPNSDVTIHLAEQVSGLQDTTRIYKFKGRITSYDMSQKTIKALRSESSDYQSKEQEQPLDIKFNKDVGPDDLSDERMETTRSGTNLQAMRKPREETFYINPSDFVNVDHQAKYMPWERRFNMEIEFHYQMLESRKQICLRMDDAYMGL
ncbi:MAG: hypothetical protein RLO04_02110 [Limnobacter sp.]|jgi:hypothetical protein|uniref:hypothetical protein n=2 Tax=Burkholderiaceae TaxID=119060 RepID=UPI000156C908|nr:MULTISPECIES: hypothetical protein [Limnobacter]EDM84803.1 hypothetical protein LMED105_04622 [Limnobacter sp. MED105]KYP10656.1 MAG: hypothetical protein A0129_11660 [Limnobacter sp. CACIAM 66H1]MBE9129614.1 hypothetical protein [Coleofasciculus sp. LEGE 07081]MDP3270948.1 hypothetical protein [Limnobacter sp.]